MGGGEATSNALQYCQRSKRTVSLNGMDGLPDGILVEILCRLPRSKWVFQCRCVCQRWRNLIDNPYFVGRFLRIQRNRKSPIRGSLINLDAETFNVDDERIRFSLNFLPINKDEGPEAIVAATYNDLALCCTKEYYPRNYYICNLYTKQYVALPPTPVRPNSEEYAGRLGAFRNSVIPVGFICDPYYIQDTDTEEGCDNAIIKTDADYRCVVVRLLPPPEFNQCPPSGVNIEMFSFETGGEWLKLALSAPQPFYYDISFDTCFAYHGMLYWLTTFGQVLVLDPFVIDQPEPNGGCHVAPFVGLQPVENRSCVRLCEWFCDDVSSTLSVWYLKRGRERRILGGADGTDVSTSLEHWERRDYSPDMTMMNERPTLAYCEMLAFDPNCEDLLYLYAYDAIYVFHIRTGWLQRIRDSAPPIMMYLLTLLHPWWPTPVPRLPGDCS